MGVEPTTCGLQNRRSAIEPHRLEKTGVSPRLERITSPREQVQQLGEKECGTPWSEILPLVMR